MQIQQTVEQLDRLLDELQVIAESDVSSSVFVEKLLGRLQHAVNAQWVGLYFSVSSSSPFLAAATGQVDSSFEPSEVFAPKSGGQSLRTMAVPVRRNSPDKGTIVVHYSSPLPTGAKAEIEEIVSAFAEVLGIRQLSEQETFLDSRWGRIQSLMSSLAASGSPEMAAHELVNGISLIADAARVTLVSRRIAGYPRIVAVSGVSKLARNSRILTLLARESERVFRDGQPFIKREFSKTAERSEEGLAHGLMPGLLGLPVHSNFESGEGKKRRFQYALLLEWDDEKMMLRSLQLANHWLPGVSAAWSQQSRWLRLPALMRRLATPAGNQIWSLVKFGTCCGLVAIIIWLLFRPMPMGIEATGTLQPENQIPVMVQIDGVVTSIEVKDGSPVKRGQVLLVMQSAELDQRLQEYDDELVVFREKLNGLRIEINQLSPSDPLYTNQQNRLSSEIRILEVQTANVERKIAFWQKQKEQLIIRAPSDGSVVAPGLERLLDGRPVREGDQLFSVVDFDGPWRLELLFADRDFGLLSQNIRLDDAGSGKVEDGDVKFVFAAAPDQWLEAPLTWVSSVATNPDGLGGVVEVHCELPVETAKTSHMGATVYAWLDCGKQPVWFVWSRGIVESVQRRLWF